MLQSISFQTEVSIPSVVLILLFFHRRVTVYFLSVTLLSQETAEARRSGCDSDVDMLKTSVIQR